MNILKTFSLNWYQGVCFKWGMLALGIAAGAYWHAFFGNYLAALLVLAVLTLTYVSYVWLRQ